MRKTLANRTKPLKGVSMPEVYAYIDKGNTVSDTAKHFGVSVSSLYKRHREYIEYCGSSEGFAESIRYFAKTGKHLPYQSYRTLAKRRRAKKQIDMSAVYEYIDKGHTILDTAKHFGVSTATLYRRHKEINEQGV